VIHAALKSVLLNLRNDNQALNVSVSLLYANPEKLKRKTATADVGDRYGIKWIDESDSSTIGAASSKAAPAVRSIVHSLLAPSRPFEIYLDRDDAADHGKDRWNSKPGTDWIQALVSPDGPLRGRVRSSLLTVVSWIDQTIMQPRRTHNP
jgi:hypothetical protein